MIWFNFLSIKSVIEKHFSFEIFASVIEKPTFLSRDFFSPFKLLVDDKFDESCVLENDVVTSHVWRNPVQLDSVSFMLVFPVQPVYDESLPCLPLSSGGSQGEPPRTSPSHFELQSGVHSRPNGSSHEPRWKATLAKFGVNWKFCFEIGITLVKIKCLYFEYNKNEHNTLHYPDRVRVNCSKSICSNLDCSTLFLGISTARQKNLDCSNQV